MSKELTEQWRNGTLKEGLYYIEGKVNYDIALIRNRYCPVLTSPYCEDNIFESEFVPVATVPTYDQFVELTEKVDQFSQMVKKVEALEKQLKEANKIIKDFVKPKPFCILCTEETEKLPESNEIKVAKEYIEKYGVENEQRTTRKNDASIS